MVAVRPADVEASLARLDPTRPVLLLFGPDSGLVRERAQAFASRALEGSTDPFALVRLDGDDIAADPARLIDEAGTIALFGGRRVIWVRAGARNIAPAIEMLLGAVPTDAVVVIEAGDLKRNAPLRSLGETSPAVRAIACYADGERDLARLVDAMMADAGLSLDRDARSELLPLLGSDRLASRNEIAKLVLYVGSERRVTADHVRAVVGDASSLLLDELSDSALAGDSSLASSIFAKAMGDGMRPDVLLGAVARALLGLHAMRLAVEGGASVERALEGSRPAIHFRRKPTVEKALRSWSAARLETALLNVDDALLAARRNASLSRSIAERALLQLASASRRGERG